MSFSLKFKDLLSDGSPNVGGKVYIYEAESNTLKDSYSDSDLSTVNSNPVVLDSNGEAFIFIVGLYKIRVEDANGVVRYTQDNLQGLGGISLTFLQEGGINWTYATTSKTLRNGDKKLYRCNSSGITATLPPNPEQGEQIEIVYLGGTDSLTIDRNGKPINSTEENMVASVENMHHNFIFVDDTIGWVMLFGGSGTSNEASVEWTAITANYMAANGEKLLADASSGAFTITLPKSPDLGAAIEILKLGSNTVDIARGGNDIMGSAADVDLTVDPQKVFLVWTGTTLGWYLNFVG